jgi:hypothetical protein
MVIAESLIYVTGSLVSRKDEMRVSSFFVVGGEGNHLLCLSERKHCRLAFVVERLSTAPVRLFAGRHCTQVLNWSESMIVEVVRKIESQLVLEGQMEEMRCSLWARRFVVVLDKSLVGTPYCSRRRQLNCTWQYWRSRFQV